MLNTDEAEQGAAGFILHASAVTAATEKNRFGRPVPDQAGQGMTMFQYD